LKRIKALKGSGFLAEYRTLSFQFRRKGCVLRLIRSISALESLLYLGPGMLKSTNIFSGTIKCTSEMSTKQYVVSWQKSSNVNRTRKIFE
ncbi:hypothetical protein C0J52_18948, partial [Blattella germanica]